MTFKNQTLRHTCSFKLTMFINQFIQEATLRIKQKVKQNMWNTGTHNAISKKYTLSPLCKHKHKLNQNELLVFSDDTVTGAWKTWKQLIATVVSKTYRGK